ncbi:MAG: hypothetical protein ACRDO7_11500 [Nocardioidaceae bacterium]
MSLFAIALYGIPVVLAVITVLIGIEGMKFYWAEVIVAPRENDEAE